MCAPPETRESAPPGARAAPTSDVASGVPVGDHVRSRAAWPRGARVPAQEFDLRRWGRVVHYRLLAGVR